MQVLFTFINIGISIKIFSIGKKKFLFVYLCLIHIFVCINIIYNAPIVRFR